ncbi:MAG: AAA family ATPase, partial [Actinomycetota bacterium]|nr:AAA family ATPase [Actinomycetota bacterium]
LALLTGDTDLESAVRETGVPGLDLLPADVSIRSADLALDDAKKPEKQLWRVLKTIRDDYDLVVLDCPPGLTLLSENVFRSADLLLVPLIPTPLSLRTYDQLLEFLGSVEGAQARVHPFFSMVDGRKRLHAEVRRELLLRTTRPLTAWVPAASIVERMAVTRKPLVVTHPSSSVARAYRNIWAELVGLLS